MMLRSAFIVGVVSAMDLVLLPESEYGSQGGRCLDGSMSGYYYGAPPSGESDLWIIQMAGGGACYDQESCASRAKGKLGSSTSWSNTYTSNGILNDEASKNPDFYDAHKVQIPYCTGDTHGGTIVTPTDAQWGYYFSGHLNFKGILEHLVDTVPAFMKAKRFLLTGGSAGGAGTILNCDFLQDELTQKGSNAKVNCAPVAGFFFPGFTEDQDDVEFPPSDWAHWSKGESGGIFATGNISQLYQSFLHPGCAKAHAPEEAFKCASASALYPFIKAPMYVMENQYDTNQLSAQLGLPKSSYSEPLGQKYIAYFGRAMRNSTQQVAAKAGDGLFLPSCLDHGKGLLDLSGGTSLKGFDGFQGLSDWFFGRNKVPAILVDDCVMSGPGLPCNPTCDSTPSPDGCKNAVEDICAHSLSDVTSCEKCALAHQSELSQAGCTTRSEVENICREQATADVVV